MKIIFELNEFNMKLLDSKKNKFANIKSLLNNKNYKTKITDKLNSNFLEPWSQWISIHTGIKAEKHGINHLGDTSFINYKQVWEINENINLVWGCLNSKKGTRNEINFFPDPWSIDENTNIYKTQNILNFLRYSVQNRYKKNYLKILYLFILAITDYFYHLKFKILKCFKFLIGTNSASELYSIFEYLNFLIFLEISKSKKIHTSIFFANLLAHYQHYYWDNQNERKINWCLKIVDNMLGECFKNFEDVIVMNGLSQENTLNKKNNYIYAPKNGFLDFLKKFDFDFKDVIPCMSYDCIVLFKNLNEKKKFIKLIDNFEIDEKNKKIFHCDDYPDYNRLFLRLDYFNEENVFFLYNNKSFKFNNYFNIIALRTGKHIQTCDFIRNKKIKLNFFTMKKYLMN